MARIKRNTSKYNPKDRNGNCKYDYSIDVSEAYGKALKITESEWLYPMWPDGVADGRSPAESVSFTTDADKIYLATDPDREGEAISWHLYTALGLEDKKVERIISIVLTSLGIVFYFITFFDEKSQKITKK